MLDNQFHEGGFNEGMKKVDCNQSKPRPPKSTLPDLEISERQHAGTWRWIGWWCWGVETTKMATIRASYALIGLLVGLLLQGQCTKLA